MANRDTLLLRGALLPLALSLQTAPAVAQPAVAQPAVAQPRVAAPPKADTRASKTDATNAATPAGTAPAAAPNAAKPGAQGGGKDGAKQVSEPKSEAAGEAPSAEPRSEPPSVEAQKRPTAIEGRVVVKVKSAEDSRKAILSGLKALGGFAQLLTDQRLHLKVPPEAVPALISLVSAQGVVLDKTLERTDLTLELANLEAQLKSKRAILAELRALFDGSDISATLQIERSMNDLVVELEAVKGKLRVSTDKARWAQIHVDFNFYEQQRINYVESRFEWLNSVKLDRFLEEF